MTDFKQKLADKRAQAALEKQLAKVKKDGAPSMIPSDRKDRDKEPPPPDISTLKQLPLPVRMKLKGMIEQQASITKTQTTLKKAKKVIADEAKILCKLYTLDKFMVGENRVLYYSAVRSSISKELLLACNVSPEIIAKCTVTTPSDTFRVIPAGMKDDGGDSFD